MTKRWVYLALICACGSKDDKSPAEPAKATPETEAFLLRVEALVSELAAIAQIVGQADSAADADAKCAQLKGIASDYSGTKDDLDALRSGASGGMDTCKTAIVDTVAAVSQPINVLDTADCAALVKVWTENRANIRKELCKVREAVRACNATAKKIGAKAEITEVPDNVCK